VSRDDEPSKRGTDEEMIVARFAVLGGGVDVCARRFGCADRNKHRGERGGENFDANDPGADAISGGAGSASASTTATASASASPSGSASALPTSGGISVATLSLVVAKALLLGCGIVSMSVLRRS
jgi:hypothetical protein